MTKYGELNRKADILIEAAKRARDHKVAADYTEKAKKLRAKALELSIEDGSELVRG